MSGKGSKRRPTDDAAYAAGYDRVFRSLVKPASDEHGNPGDNHHPAYCLDDGNAWQAEQHASTGEGESEFLSADG